MQSIQNQLNGYREKGRRLKKWKKIVTALACVVVFCTVYALILPAITLEGNTYCDKEEHTHSDECYKEAVAGTEKKLVCTKEEVEPHTHSDGCYEIRTVEVPVEETIEVPAEEAEPAAVSETTEGAEPAAVSETTEGAEPAAVSETPATKTVTVTKTETKEEQVLVCEKAETEGHAHGNGCYEEVEVYGDPELDCSKEEHNHSKSCYSNPNADVETEAEWKKTFDDVTFTNDWVVDTLAIAKTQLGYNESNDNYIVLENGDTKGYTRYGEWYGDKYGDWCAMFVSFCLNYAEVEDFPLEAGCQNWILKIKELEEASKDEDGVVQYNAWQEATEEYIPEKGNVIFFNWDSAADSDHVGIVVGTTTDEEGKTTITTIEGNASDTVKYKEYDLENQTIMGYGILPAQEFYCGMQGHAHDDDCYDEANELVCEIEEHIHIEECEEKSELTEEEQAEVDAVIAAIDALPTADEFDAKLLEYEEAEDMESYEAYWTEIQTQCQEAYAMYEELSETQKAYVTNIDKLMELEWLWSVETYNSSVTSAVPNTTWYTSTKDFVELNLYDYNGYVNANYWTNNNSYPGFQWNGGAYAYSNYKIYNANADDGIPNYVLDRNRIDSIDFGNSLITNLTYGGGSSGNYSKAVNSTNVVRTSANYSETSPTNWIYGNSSEGYTNKPIGVSTTDASYSNVMNYVLGADGYPKLANGISLKYLFTNGTPATKLNTESIDGLFQRDDVTGEYSYNSRTNHAEYTNNFFQLYDEIITPNFITYPFGNFLPLNTISDSSKATQVGAFNNAGGMKQYVEQTISDLKNDTEGLGTYWNGTQEQLITMLEEYRENWTIYPRTFNGVKNNWSNLSPANAIRDYFLGDTSGSGDKPSADTSFITQDFLNHIYNIDWDVQTNFFFGMEMKMNFMMPKDGMTGNDTNKDGQSDYPMKFYFTGDDDVWVYIDGVLFLDLSGIHRHVGGEIDFVNGKVHYYALDPENGGDVSSTPYKTYTFAEILTVAGKSTNVLNSKGTFTDYSTHSFNFYYMERGSGSSVCRLNFNFPLLKKNSISVTKEVSSDTESLGNPDYKFQVLKANSDGTKTEDLFIASGTTYTIYDQNNKEIGTGTTDANGVFTLKAGQRAEFTGIKENAGKYYVRELLEGTVLEQYGNVTVSGESTTTSNNITIGSDTFTGMDSPVKDMSDGATSFRFTNDVDESKLGDLSISKKLTEYPVARTIKYFDIQVKLDGEDITVGTEYTVGSETRKVTTAGIITIAADETATISNILAGTEFTVQETSGSAEGYTVTYSDSGGYTINVTDGVVIGIIKTSANVQLVVTNAEKGATVTIPGTKTILNPDGQVHTYTFQLDEVTDSTGSTLKVDGIEAYEATATVNEESPTGLFTFNINYVAVDYEGFPQDFYYKITELDAEDSLANNTTYIVKVTVSKVDGGIEAKVTGMWQDGDEITDSSKYSLDFVNTLSGALKLSKTVVGDDSDFGVSNEFTFEIKLESAETKDYLAKLFKTDGSSEETIVSFKDGIANVQLKAGESIQILDVVCGTTWTITERNADGYKVTYDVTVNDTTERGNGNKLSGTISVGTTNVTYTNTKQYELPEAGGTGTNLFIIGGLTLICCAMFLLYNNKKRGKEETASS